MTTRSRFARVALAALVPFAAACGDDDPVGPVDVMPVTAERLEALRAAIAPLSAQPVLGAFLFARFPRGLPDDENLPFAPAPRGAMDVADAADAGTRPRGQFTTPIRGITIPDSLRGLTFVKDTAMFGWRRDTLPDGRPRPGAPANGVRFVLADAVFGDGAPLGYMDLTQTGTTTAPLLLVDVYDLADAKVQHFGGSLSATSLAGWTARGAARIDQVSARVRGGITTTWSGSGGLTLSAQRGESIGTQAFVTTHRLTVDGTELLLQASELIDDDDFRTTFTVLVGAAPFARRVDDIDTGGAAGTWQHLASERPLNGGELAQVDAFIRVLRALPDAESSFQEAIFALMSLQNIGFPFAPAR